mgnify:CR=1 FL=1
MSEIRKGGLGPYSLEGRVAVIVGGSSGIGAATARRFAEAGAHVVVGYNSSRREAEELAAGLPGEDHLALHIPLTDTPGIEAAAAAVKARFGKVDVLVNSGATTKGIPHADLQALDDETFDRILVTNVRGPFATVRAFEALLRSSGDAVVLNISSLSAVDGLGSSIAYCASKAALDTMAMSLARVLAPTVRVIGISPAAVKTDFVPGRRPEDVEKAIGASQLKIMTEPDDIAVAAVSAVTGLRLMTGSTVLVDGGRHL